MLKVRQIVLEYLDDIFFCYILILEDILKFLKQLIYLISIWNIFIYYDAQRTESTLIDSFTFGIEFLIWLFA